MSSGRGFEISGFSHLCDKVERRLNKPAGGACCGRFQHLHYCRFIRDQWVRGIGQSVFRGRAIAPWSAGASMTGGNNQCQYQTEDRFQ